MTEMIKSVVASMVSAILGVDLKDIQKTLDKAKLKDAGKLDISDNIDAVSKKLEDSKEMIETALLEVEKQKTLFDQMRKEAEISQQISSMNQEQIDALNEVLEKTLNKQDKKTFPKTFFWNLFFCVLSAVLGFVLGKFL